MTQLNREDIRKVLEAYIKVKNSFKDSGKDLADIPMREIQEAVLGELKEQDNISQRDKK